MTTIKAMTATGTEVEIQPRGKSDCGRLHAELLLTFRHPQEGECWMFSRRYEEGSPSGAVGSGRVGSKSKSNILISISREAFDEAMKIAVTKAEAAVAAEAAKERESAARAVREVPVGFIACRRTWSNGDFCSAKYAAPDGTEVFSSDLLESHAGFYWIPAADIDVTRAKVEAVAVAAKARVDAAKAKEAAAIEAAASAGKPVELNRWTEDCDGSADECDTDLCVRYVLPSGAAKIERTHAH